MRRIWKVLLAGAALAGAGVTAPAARAHDGYPARVETRRVVVRETHTLRCTWIAARWEERVERVVVREGHWRVETREAEYAWRLDTCNWRLVRVVLRPGSVTRTWVPAVVEERRTRVLIPGRWECHGRSHC